MAEHRAVRGGGAPGCARPGEVARQRLAWRALGAILLFFSLDELALLQEEIVERAADEPGGEPLVLALLLRADRVCVPRRRPATARDVRHALGSIRLLVAGFACLGVALVLDGASAEYMDEPWPWHPSVVVEESLELLGPLLLAVVGLAVWEGGVASASTGARE